MGCPKMPWRLTLQPSILTRLHCKYRGREGGKEGGKEGRREYLFFIFFSSAGSALTERERGREEGERMGVAHFVAVFFLYLNFVVFPFRGSDEGGRKNEREE